MFDSTIPNYHLITHLGRTGLIEVGWLRHVLLYEPVPEAFH